MTEQDPQPCHVCENRPHTTMCDMCGEVVCEQCIAEDGGNGIICLECQDQVEIESVCN